MLLYPDKNKIKASHEWSTLGLTNVNIFLLLAKKNLFAKIKTFKEIEI